MSATTSIHDVSSIQLGEVIELMVPSGRVFYTRSITIITKEGYEMSFNLNSDAKTNLLLEV